MEKKNLEPIRSFLLVFVARLMSLSSVAHLFSVLTSCSVCFYTGETKRRKQKKNDAQKGNETQMNRELRKMLGFLLRIHQYNPQLIVAHHVGDEEKKKKKKKGGKPSRRQSLNLLIHRSEKNNRLQFFIKKKNKGKELYNSSMGHGMDHFLFETLPSLGLSKILKTKSEWKRYKWTTQIVWSLAPDDTDRLAIGEGWKRVLIKKEKTFIEMGEEKKKNKTCVRHCSF